MKLVKEKWEEDIKELYALIEVKPNEEMCDGKPNEMQMNMEVNEVQDHATLIAASN